MRELEYFFDNYTDWPARARDVISPVANKAVYHPQHSREVCLIETVARAIILDDCGKITRNFERSYRYAVNIREVNRTSRNRIRDFLGGIYAVIREYRWWIDFELSTAEDGHSVNDEELTNGVLECIRNWKWSTLDPANLIHNVSPSRVGLLDITEITATETVEEAVQ